MRGRIVNVFYWGLVGVLLLASGGLTLAHVLSSARERGPGYRLAPEAHPFAVADQPVTIYPIPAPGSLSVDELRRILGSTEPRFDLSVSRGRPPVMLIGAALRLWGERVAARKTPSPDGKGPLDRQGLLDILLNNEVYEEYSDLPETYLLVRSCHGIEVVTVLDHSDRGIEDIGQVGKLTEILADINLPADRAVVAKDGVRGVVAEIVRDDAARSFPGTELEFLTSGLCRYAKDGRPWANRFGQRQSFDDLATLLIKRSPGTGTCVGSHVPYALSMLYRSDQARPLVAPSTARRIRDYLRGISARLEANQLPEGYWDARWFAQERISSGPGKAYADLTKDQRLEILIATGHALEWMAFAPEDCRPRPDVIRRSVRFLADHWPQVTKLVEEDRRHYDAASHAARALWMLSGLEPPNYAMRKDGGD
jgi:hypothetical protein